MRKATHPICKCGHACLDEHRPVPEGGCKICPIGVCNRYGTYLQKRRDGTYFECSNANWNPAPLLTGSHRFTHGARTPKRVAARAQEIMEALTERIPIVSELTRDQVERYCEVRAKESLYGEYIDGVLFGEIAVAGNFGVTAVPEYVIQSYIRLATLGQKICQELGMDPTGYAKLAKDYNWAKKLHTERLDELQARGMALRKKNPALGASEKLV